MVWVVLDHHFRNWEIVIFEAVLAIIDRLLHDCHWNMPLLQKYDSIELMLYLGYFYSPDHPYDKSGQLMSMHLLFIEQSQIGTESQIGMALSDLWLKSSRFVIFSKFEIFWKNQRQKASIGTNHTYRVQISWSGWSQTTSFRIGIQSFSRQYWPI